MRQARHRKVNTCCIVLVTCGIQTNQTERKSRVIVARGWGLIWRKLGDTSQRVQSFSYRVVSSSDPTYSMMTIVTNTALYTWKSLRVGPKCSHRTKIQWLCEVTDMVINLFVIITSQCICILNYHIVYLECIYFCQLYFKKVGKNQYK